MVEVLAAQSEMELVVPSSFGEHTLASQKDAVMVAALEHVEGEEGVRSVHKPAFCIGAGVPPWV